MRTASLLLFVTLSVHALSQPQTLTPLKWLEGVWQQQGASRYEKWTFVNDTLANGLAYIKNDEGESIPDELIQLKVINGVVYYMPLVKNQNEGKVVEFKVVRIRKNMFVAENPAHDYPQRIVYKKVSSSRLLAYIEKLNGEKRMVFWFVRTP
ncbi:MAG: DUF6265 family protein [Chitinophagales bacterium]|nr:DUF6265 family protein [Chitinophagales bacterium]MDW8419297.1 DUF6265 family protein [Chitinophagales bacterium]